MATATQPLSVTPAQVSRRTPVGRLLARSLLVCSDLLAVNVGVFAAWYSRYELMLGGDVEPFDQVSYERFLTLGLVLSLLVVVVFFVGSLYQQQAAFWFNDFFAIFGRCGFAVMVLFAAATMIRYPANSRLTFIYIWLLTTVFVALGRLLVQLITGALHRRGVGSERVLVVGENALGQMVMQGIAAQPHLGLMVAGFVAEQRTDNFGRFRYLGQLDAIEAVIREQGIDQVIVALPSASHEAQLRIVEHCRRANVRFKLVPDLFEMSLRRIDLDSVGGVPLIDLKEVSIDGGNLLLKRLLDLLLTLLALIPGSLLMLGVALLVKLDSRGPVIYRQTRVGKNGKHFTLFKFRSMRVDAELLLDQLMPENEADGPIFKKRDDPRMTRAGRLIRRASLDELPQLFNVLRGEMSLVGPRPPLPREVEQYEDWHRGRLRVAPGLTGLWQVSGRSELNFEEMVVFDLTYIQNWSLSLDLSILLRTVPAVLRGGGAF